jgi:hypothetical protein
LKLKDVAKLLSAQYLKEDYAENILENHLGQVCPGITKESFILISHKSDQNQKNKRYVIRIYDLVIVRIRYRALQNGWSYARILHIDIFVTYWSKAISQHLSK